MCKNCALLRNTTPDSQMYWDQYRTENWEHNCHYFGVTLKCTLSRDGFHWLIFTNPMKADMIGEKHRKSAKLPWHQNMELSFFVFLSFCLFVKGRYTINLNLDLKTPYKLNELLLVRNLVEFHRDLCPAAHWTQKNLESFSCFWKLWTIWNSWAAVTNKRPLELSGRRKWKK